MRLTKVLLYGLCSSIIILASCKKDDDPTGDVILKNGMFALCEGLFQQNNSSLTWVNFNNGSSVKGFFQNKNERGLGDTGNDMRRYGGKIYIVVNVSSTIEVLNASTGFVQEQIQMIENGVSKQPRSIAFSGGKAYISCYDGFVDVLDTASLTIVNRIPVGSNPEGLEVSGDKLFVANSGGLNFPAVDSTVSIIDLNTEMELSRVVVGKNPGDVEVDSQGDVYVISRGDYTTIPSRMHRIDPVSMSVAENFTFDAGSISIMNDKFLISYSDFVTADQHIGLFNPGTEQMENISLIDLSAVQTVYDVSYHPSGDRIYVADAKNYTITGDIHVFDSNGSPITTYATGLNPSKMLFFEP